MRDHNVVAAALRRARRAMGSVMGFSFVVNALLLTAPLFMLQVYDRVLLSQSQQTLLGLVVVAGLCMLLLLCVEVIRHYLLNRISVQFDRDLGQPTFSQVMAEGQNSQPVHDLNRIRSFLNAPYLTALFDVPWMPLYLGFVYLLHPLLGHIGLAGALILFSLAIANEVLTRTDSEKAGQAFSSASRFVEHGARNKDAILGMGMLPALTGIWGMYQRAGLGHQSVVADRNALVSSIAKVVRQLIQIAVLATGAYLTIQGSTTAGVMIAASIIIARALAPVEQSIQGWTGLAKTRQSYKALRHFMQEYETAETGTSLPVPRGEIHLQNVVAVNASDDAVRRPVIKNISFKINAGDSVGITGPSGSGKSTLIKLMLGIIPPASGTVRIDGAEMNRQVREQFSAHIGYLPQNVELFDGTVAENIARFTQDNNEAVVKAAMMAGAHELILSLPKGYETEVGPSGENLSGGQCQRIGLARAMYEEPTLVVLDEPASNLDQEGSAALLRAIGLLKQRGATVILIAHQNHLFRVVDKVAVIHAGQLKMYGPREDVLAELQPQRVALQTQEKSSRVSA